MTAVLRQSGSTAQACGSVNGQPVTVGLATEPEPDAAAVVTVTATLRLAWEDLVASLFVWDNDGGSMADPARTRELVLEAVLNIGLCQLADAKAALHGRLNADADAWRIYCQQRAAELLVSTARPALADVPSNGGVR